MSEHWTVALVEDIQTDIDCQVRPHPQNVRIKGGMMEFAERDPIGNDWLPFRMPVGQYVRGVQQLSVRQPAHRATLPIGPKHALPKAT
jgi:hypothetical protein